MLFCQLCFSFSRLLWIFGDFFVSIYFERSLWLEWELIKVGENEGRGIVPGRKDEGGGKKKLRKFIW